MLTVLSSEIRFFAKPQTVIPSRSFLQKHPYQTKSTYNQSTPASAGVTRKYGIWMCFILCGQLMTEIAGQ
jgi:hypothetical protein